MATRGKATITYLGSRGRSRESLCIEITMRSGHAEIGKNTRTKLGALLLQRVQGCQRDLAERRAHYVGDQDLYKPTRLSERAGG